MRFALLAATLGAATLLSSCGAFERNVPPVCPEVVILSDASRITKFRDGPGRDLTDVEVEAEINGYRGECKRVEKGVEVTLAIAMNAKRGPGDADGAADLAYFVAIPDYFPSPQAKSVFTTRLQFPANVGTMRHVDGEVVMMIPQPEGKAATPKEVYLGFQLDEEQLRFNRDKRGR